MYIDVILMHGLIYTGGFVLIILISVLINPRIWMQDFPDVLKNDIPPKTIKEVKQTFVTGFLFSFFIVGFPLYSLSIILDKSNVDLNDSNLFLHSFSVMMICNILYWLIFHSLIFNVIISKIRTVPGLKGKITFSGWKKLIFGMFVGVLTCAMISWFVTFIARLFS